VTTKSPSPVATKVSWQSTKPVTLSTNPSKRVFHLVPTATLSQETLATADVPVNVYQSTAAVTPTSTSHSQLIQWSPFTSTHHAAATVVTAEEAHQEEAHLEADPRQEVDHLEDQLLSAAHATAAQREPTAVTWESTSLNVKVKAACGVHPTKKVIHGALKYSQAVGTAVPTAHQAAKSTTILNKTAAISALINRAVKAKGVAGLNLTLVALHGASTQLKLTFLFLFCFFTSR